MKLLILTLCIMLCSCSYAVLSGQDKTAERCSELYYAAPVFDTAASILSITVIAVLPAAVALSSLGTSSRTNDKEVKQILGISIVSIITFGSSSIYGYNKTYRCSSK